ncbi:ASCH domain-containing protein [Candidatus Magnetominusculus dajiuhuensis]|uniref:ASCH domain-containing protein n=1 Tax=Candidatus Magnetominusculus dajiuhuensis TaxID=3137712 RepID=UPI003B4388E7
MTKRHILISIKPEYAKMIFDGTKTVELRRKFPKLERRCLAFVYATAPVKALIGVCQIEKVISAPPEELWWKVGKQAGITYDEYNKYFSGASEAYGIFFSVTTLFPEPIPLHEVWVDIKAPQSYRYINSKLLRETS